MARAAIADGGTAQLGVPIEYAIDRLAQRYGVPPWELARPERAVWLQRGLIFQRLEAEAHKRKA